MKSDYFGKRFIFLASILLTLLLVPITALAGSETQVTTNPKYQGYPVTSGDKIVWHDYRNGNYDIYMYDISTGTETQVTTSTEYQGYAAISGDKIVWSDYRNGNYDIYMYDTSAGTETQVTTNTEYQGTPAISGDKIVWHDYRNGNYDIYMYDISAGTETQVTTNTQYQGSPAISGNNIVWLDYRNGNGDIYMYDISAGTETQVTTSTLYQGAPEISSNYIVWHDYRIGDYNIYMYKLKNNTPPVADVRTDQTMLAVGAEIELDGTYSYDADLDPLTFSWSLTSAPAGSTAFITEPSEGYALFTADVPSDEVNFVVELIVNDGTVDSEPVSIEILVLTGEDMVSLKLEEVIEGLDALSELNPDSFRNSGSAVKLNVKVEKVLKEVEKGNYDNALETIDKLLLLLDGCTLSDTDTKDEIIDCAEQEALYDILIEARAIILGMI
jgi:beta propeller repeat protein